MAVLGDPRHPRGERKNLAGGTDDHQRIRPGRRRQRVMAAAVGRRGTEERAVGRSGSGPIEIDRDPRTRQPR